MITVFSSVLATWGNSGGGGASKRPVFGRGLSVLAVLVSLVLAVLLAPSAHAQATQNTTIQPDCLVPFTLTAAGNSPTANVANAPNDNRNKGCAAWTLKYQSTGLTSITVTLQSGCSTSTTVSYGTFAGAIPTTPSGNANPIVSDTGGQLQAINGTACISWVRVNVAATGSGTLTGVLYGFRNSSAAVNGGGTGGSLTPCGPTVGEVQLYLNSTTLGCDPSFYFLTSADINGNVGLINGFSSPVPLNSGDGPANIQSLGSDTVNGTPGTAYLNFVLYNDGVFGSAWNYEYYVSGGTQSMPDNICDGCPLLNFQFWDFEGSAWKYLGGDEWFSYPMSGYVQHNYFTTTGKQLELSYGHNNIFMEVGFSPVAPGVMELNSSVPTADGGTLAQWNMGVAQILNDVANSYLIARVTASAVAPGADKCGLYPRNGTLGGTLKYVIGCGTGTTEVTIADNIGTGN